MQEIWGTYCLDCSPMDYTYILAWVLVNTAQ